MQTTYTFLLVLVQGTSRIRDPKNVKNKYTTHVNRTMHSTSCLYNTYVTTYSGGTGPHMVLSVNSIPFKM